MIHIFFCKKIIIYQKKKMKQYQRQPLLTFGICPLKIHVDACTNRER